jgi:antitoxin (DNA-binding transcriptional repressor) of toxin-antitoxin stability system
MKSVSIEQAQEQLPELIHLVEQGEDVVIERDDLPAVKLIIEPVSKPKKRKFGQHRGKVHIRSDFDEPLPDSFWLEGKL